MRVPLGNAKEKFFQNIYRFTKYSILRATGTFTSEFIYCCLTFTSTIYGMVGLQLGTVRSVTKISFINESG